MGTGQLVIEVYSVCVCVCTVMYDVVPATFELLGSRDLLL